MLVSIHAPARGATPQSASSLPAPKFQSTLPHGERLATIEDLQKAIEFQSTLPHGERLNPIIK